MNVATLKRNCPLELSNGHRFDFASAAGALAFDGRGWPWEWPYRWMGRLQPEEFTIVAKTVTMEPRKGNLRWFHPWTCFRLLPGGNAVNAIGLTNPGIEAWIKDSYPITQKMGYKTAISIMPKDIKEATSMGKMLRSLNLVYIEVNISCPNLKDGHPDFSDVSNMLCVLGEESNHPILVKLSFDQAMCDPLLDTLANNGSVEAIHAINTVPWEKIFGDRRSPLKKHTGVNGGISGPSIYWDYTCIAVENIRKRCPNMGIVAGGGISNVADCVRLNNLGAQAFSIGTMFIRDPGQPNRLVEEFRKNKERNGIHNTNLDHNRSDPVGDRIAAGD